MGDLDIIDGMRDDLDAAEATIERYKLALEEIRDIARVSEGVEFYAMLAQKALDGAD